MEELLKTIYYDPNHPAGFGGVDAVYHAAQKENNDIGRNRVREWLSQQPTYTLHKGIRRKFKRNRVIVYGIDHQWQVDLVDVQNLARQNKGFKYLLTCIDIFSKYAWVIPMKDKKGQTLVRAFQEILEDGRQPAKLQSDKGTEFTNRAFQQLLKDREIRFFTTNNETKASVVERFNRTLKERMWKYFTSKNTRKYIDVVDQLVSAYNRRNHSSIGRAPVDVKDTNEKDVWLTLYGDRSEKKKAAKKSRYRFKVGDQVRIGMTTQPFRKGYLPKWTEEIFRVVSVIDRSPPVYKLEDYEKEPIEGTFYAQELQKVLPPSDDVYKIERIISSRKRRGVTEYLVKWQGYPDKFNSYVTDIINLK